MPSYGIVPSSYFHCSGDGLVTLHSSFTPSEDTTDGLEAFVFLSVDIHSSLFPMHIIREVGHILIPWAQSYLLLSRNKPYSDPEFAQIRIAEYQYELGVYMNKIGTRRTNKNRGFSA